MIKEKNTIGQYVCAICGNPYGTIQERAKCEMACIKRIEAEEKKAAEAKKKAEQSKRQNEVDEAVDHATKLIKEFINDHGYYNYKGKSAGVAHWPSRIWHDMLF